MPPGEEGRMGRRGEGRWVRNILNPCVHEGKSGCYCPRVLAGVLNVVHQLCALYGEH